MYGILASQVQDGGKPLLLTVTEDDGSGGVLRAYPADPRYKAGQRWKRVLGYGPYRSRSGLFRFGYAYVTEAFGRPQVMTAMSAPAGQQGGVVRTWFTT